MNPPNFRYQEIKECITCQHIDIAFEPTADGNERSVDYCQKYNEATIDAFQYGVCDDWEQMS